MTQNPLVFQPPIARKEHKETALHGTVLTDDYAWLRDKENPEVTAYLEAENAYAEAVMAPLAGLREELYQEMLSHVKQTDVSVPFRDGAGGTTPAPKRAGSTPSTAARTAHPTGRGRTPEQVILDGNLLAEGHAFFRSIGATDITDDGRWLAYTTDTTGFRQYTLHIKDLETGETLPG
jgi:oligopeptidase B